LIFKFIIDTHKIKKISRKSLDTLKKSG